MMSYTKGNPMWSVMIPTFNCAKFLEQTLLSVLAQDPGEEIMQIEVVDDFSTKDDPKEVVDRIGRGRVKYFQQPINVGAIKNFNTCIERANGELVHILHGDDWVANGFYDEIVKLYKKYPNAGLYATRVFYTNADNIITGVSNYLEKFSMPTNDNSDLFYENQIQFAGIVVKKDIFYSLGFFDETLVHTADVEMWNRIIHFKEGVISNKLLAYYRLFEGNDTAKLSREAKNLVDLKRLSCKLKNLYKGFDSNKFNVLLNKKAEMQLKLFLKLKDYSSAKNNLGFYFKNMGFGQRLAFVRNNWKILLHLMKSDFYNKKK